MENETTIDEGMWMVDVDTREKYGNSEAGVDGWSRMRSDDACASSFLSSRRGRLLRCGHASSFTF